MIVPTKHFVIGKDMDTCTICKQGLVELDKLFLGPKFLILLCKNFPKPTINDLLINHFLVPTNCISIIIRLIYKHNIVSPKGINQTKTA